MNLDPYIEEIRRQLEVTAAAGGEAARELTARLVAPLESAIRLAIQDALSAAAEEITVDLAPGSVELRLRGREPEFVVTPPPTDHGPDDPGADDAAAARWTGNDPDGAVARINVRMPQHLKAQIELAADVEGLSTNAWLVRAAATSIERGSQGGRQARRAAQGAQRYSGWAR
jgi:hypothetical protein